MRPILKLENVCRYFTASQGIFAQARKLVAVNNVSLELHQGESLGLVGESGCGKSTLGRMACGLLAPSAGEARLRDKPLPLASARSWAAGKMQMVFQDPGSSLDPRMTVLASVAEPLRARGGETSAQRRLDAAAMLDAVGLGNMGDRYPHQFSGGQRQRIAVARALVTHPDVIVCDEPVSALDASVQAQILNLLKDMQARFQPAYLFISHDLAVVGFMCPRILVMYLGRIVEEANREQLFNNAAHPYSHALLAAMPQGEAQWAHGRGLDCLPAPLSGELPSPLNPPSGCHFHPRCPRARDICKEAAPGWTVMGPGWRVRCHFPGYS